MTETRFPFRSKVGSGSRHWIIIATVTGLLALSGCGDEEGSPDALGKQNTVQNDVSKVNTPEPRRTPAGFEVHEGVRLADGLIAELSAIPLPDGPVVFQVGEAHSADMDPRRTAIQTVHFTLPPRELFDFYLAALPSAGYEIKSSADGFAQASQAVIEFTDVDGLPGRLFFRPGAWSKSQMRINLYRSGIAD